MKISRRITQKIVFSFLGIVSYTITYINVTNEANNVHIRDLDLAIVVLNC